MFRAGDGIGPYKLIKKLGKGGFGEVWLAEEAGAIMAAQVALKMPFDEDASIEVVKKEASVWVQASGHPNVLPFYKAAQYDDQLVIISEYAPDGSLRDWLKRHGGKSPAIREAMRITDGILAGLEHLHSRRIIHRDLKPDNVLMQGNTPRLADFGIARVMKSSALSMTISGTPNYMAPEAFKGKRDEQTDVWAVGVILYQVVSGQLPFPQSDIGELYRAIVHDSPPPLPAEVPPPLLRVVFRALHKDEAGRYQTAIEMREALQEARRLIDTSVPKPPPPLPIPQSTPTPPPKQQPAQPQEDRETQRGTVLVLKAEAGKLFDAGRFEEAIRKWQEVGKLAPYETEVEEYIQTAQKRLREIDPKKIVERPVVPPPMGEASQQSAPSPIEQPPNPNPIVVPSQPQSLAPAPQPFAPIAQPTAMKAASPPPTPMIPSERKTNRLPWIAGTGLLLIVVIVIAVLSIKPNTAAIIKDLESQMVKIQGGTFLMGSPSYEVGRFDDEGPQHRVTVSTFYMGKYEVTQAQWQAVAQLPKVKVDLPSDPSAFKDDHLPVEQVSWEEAVEFCERLSQATGKKYRLPTEAEWEYACRAGTTGAYAGNKEAGRGNDEVRHRVTVSPSYMGKYEVTQTQWIVLAQAVDTPPPNMDEMAWYDKNSGKKTHPVGQKKANAWGLYDMYGNVWEFCSDWYGNYSSVEQMDPAGSGTGSDRVARGGSWNDPATNMRSASRGGDKPSGRSSRGGFRLSRTYN